MSQPQEARRALREAAQAERARLVAELDRPHAGRRDRNRFRESLSGGTRFADADRPLKMFFSMGVPSTSLTRNSYPFCDGMARVLAARGDVAGAIDAYRRLLTLDLSQQCTAVLEPRLMLQLARLLERQGNRAAARQEYQRFLELWKLADAELPELAEARKKVATLATSTN